MKNEDIKKKIIMIKTKKFVVVFLFYAYLPLICLLLNL